VQCNLDGALYTIYDSIKELFEEEGEEEGRTGSNEALLNAIRVDECYLQLVAPMNGYYESTLSLSLSCFAFG
jgi:hypothetical protein